MAKISHIVLPVSDLQKSREWYVDKLRFSLDREREGAIGVKDGSGLTIFLIATAEPLQGPRITLTVEVDSIDRTYQELAALGRTSVTPPQQQSWGYGVQAIDPDGYVNHLWDQPSMERAKRERSGS